MLSNSDKVNQQVREVKNEILHPIDFSYKNAVLKKNPQNKKEWKNITHDQLKKILKQEQYLRKTTENTIKSNNADICNELNNIFITENAPKLYDILQELKFSYIPLGFLDNIKYNQFLEIIYHCFNIQEIQYAQKKQELSTFDLDGFLDD